MMRWFFWGLLALSAHASLLLLPLSDLQTVNAGRSEVTVKISSLAGEVKPVPDLSRQVSTVSLSDHEADVHLPTPSISEPAHPVGRAAEQKPVNADKAVQKLPVKSQIAQTKSVAKRPVTTENVERIVEKQTVETAESSRSDQNNQEVNHRERTLSIAENPEKQVAKRPVYAQPASNRKPKYPRRAIVRNQQGSVSVELVIKKNGEVGKATLLSSSGYSLLDRAVMTFVDNERFLPRIEQGIPVDSTQLFIYRFVLN